MHADGSACDPCEKVPKFPELNMFPNIRVLFKKNSVGKRQKDVTHQFFRKMVGFRTPCLGRIRSANLLHFFSASAHLNNKMKQSTMPIPVFRSTTNMVPRTSLSLALLSVLMMSPFTYAATVDMGKIIVRLTSSVTTENDVLSAHMLLATGKYMNNYFKAYYKETKSSDYFSSAILRVKPFEIQGSAEPYVTEVEFAGMLSFKVDPAPSHSFVDTLTVNAFEGGNLDIYIESLLESESKFLNNLVNIVVEVHDNGMVEKSIEDTSEANQENSEEKPEDDLLEGWSAVLIYGMAIVAGVMLSVALFCLCRCCFLEKRQIDGLPVNLKTIDVPKDVDRRIQTQNRESRRSIVTDPTEPTKNKGEMKDTFYCGNLPASPELSMTSQDSSKFTYNPDEMSVLSYATGGVSLVSKASLGLGNFNRVMGTDNSVSFEPSSKKHQLHEEERNATAAFGNVAMNKDPPSRYRGLDQIEEGNEVEFENYRPRSTRTRTTSSATLEIRKPRRTERPASKLRAPQTRYSYRSNGSAFGNESDYLTESSSSPSSRGSNDSSNDVIDDLKDLSFQIEMCRSGRH